MILRKFKDLSPLILIEIVIALIYSQILSSFFQQDEWLSFARHIILKEEGFKAIFTDAFLPSVGHYQPFNTLTINFFFSIFNLNYIPYAITSIFLHLVNVTLLFLLAKKIFNGMALPLIVATIFGISASIYQATTWVLADIGIHFATIFALLCLILFFEFLNKGKLIHFYFSIIFLIISLLYKEIAIGLFLLLPISFFLFGNLNSFDNVKKRKYLTIILGVCTIYILFRVIMVFLPQSYSRDALVTKSQSVRDLSYNFLTFPFKAMSQSIIPTDVLLDLSYSIGSNLLDRVTGEKNTTAYGQFVEKKILETVNIFVNLIVIAALIYLWRRSDKNFRKVAVLALLLILLNSSIFALSPERSGKVTIIDSRNLYFTAIGSAFLLGFIFWSLKSIVLKAGLCFIFLALNAYWLNIQIGKIVEDGLLRKDILSQISKDYPVLPEKTIFYTESDKTYYGLPDEELILPFQSGFGQTLLIWYYPTEKFPLDFLKNRFLWEIKDQGYKQSLRSKDLKQSLRSKDLKQGLPSGEGKEVDGRGFGYIRNFELLKKTVKDYNIDLNSIIGFSWKSKTGILLNITDQLREELKSN